MGFSKSTARSSSRQLQLPRLKKTIDIVLARLDAHYSKIQGVSDQVQMAQARQAVLSQP